MLDELPGARFAVEMPVRQTFCRASETDGYLFRRAVGDQHFGRTQALELRGEHGQRRFLEPEIAAGEIQPGESNALALAGDGE